MTTPYTGNGPDELGFFGKFGGCYMPESSMPALQELEQAFNTVRHKPEFWAEYQHILTDFVGRPSPLFYAKNLTAYAGGARIYLKREDLNHTGAHKINNCVGQILLAKFMGKTRIIAETGAGQHGVATATVCALFKMKCTIFMGETDIQRQQMNVERMKLLGAEVRSVQKGRGTLKDAMNEAMRDWVTNIDTTYYLIGSVLGPHPYPMMVRDFQKIIGQEAKQQHFELEGKSPKAVIACVGGGSNAMGLFYEFIEDAQVRLIGVEAAGKGVDTLKHAATINKGRSGIFHGMKSLFLQNSEGQIDEVYSISAGLDYPGIGPEHAYLHSSGRAEYLSATDEQAVQAFEYLARTEGIIPAIESAHAVHIACQLAPTLKSTDSIIICLSGRGDKDVQQIARYRGISLHE